MRALLPAFLTAASVGGLGCGSSETANNPGPDPAGPTCANVDPSVAGPDAACGVFVSASLGSDDNPGTMERPFRTLARGFAAALEGAQRVYACAEVFTEAAELPAGVELWGGLACAEGWGYLGETEKTTIAPGLAGVIPLRVLSGEAPVRVADVRAEAADGIEPGQSSIAAMVLPGTPVELLRCELIAGNGAPGAEGERGGGPDEPEQLPSGADGLPGGMACQANVNPGGAAVVTVCGDVESIGGKGGNGRITYGDDGDDGLPVPDNPDGHGDGGWGQNSGHTQCIGGQVGQAGRDGDHGLGGSDIGRLTLAGWQGERGQDGGDGLPGQGGGGGGGLRGPLYSECGSGNPRSGAGGGSGGAGGCGGKGGKGGGYGGASIALIALTGGSVELRRSTLLAHAGGEGGRGGFWQGGGLGGNPGPGGAGIPGVAAGCLGGPGGQGGNGGFGGGGLGGISVDVAYAEALPLLDGVYMQPGKGGAGGPGGSPFVTLPGTTGGDGFAGDTLELPAL